MLHRSPSSTLQLVTRDTSTLTPLRIHTKKARKKEKKNIRDMDGSADDTSQFPIFNFTTLQPYWGHWDFWTTITAIKMAHIKLSKMVVTKAGLNMSMDGWIIYFWPSSNLQHWWSSVTGTLTSTPPSTILCWSTFLVCSQQWLIMCFKIMHIVMKRTKRKWCCQWSYYSSFD